MRCAVLVLIATLFILPGPAAARMAEPAGGPRVRPGDARSALLLREGAERSPTFDRMLHALDGGDLVVYVTMDPQLPRNIAGTLTWTTKTPLMRYVRIAINPSLRRASAVAALGHELQHAIEVAAHPEIDDAGAFHAFYAATGDQGGSGLGSFDTADARDAGRTVRAELRQTPASTWARNGFGPGQWYAWYARARSGAAGPVQGPQ